MFQMNKCAKVFWNPCINVQVMAWTSSIYDHFIIWTSSVTLTFKLPEQMFQMNNCAKLHCILKSMHKYRNYGPDKLNLWPFYNLTIKCDLDLQPTWTNVLNCTSTPQGEQLCQIILKIMHKCRSYGPDKLNLCAFYYLTFRYDLDLQPTWTYISNGMATHQGEQLCHIILKSILKCIS